MGDLHIYNTGGSTNDFVISNGGNVGIGTSSPLDHLHIKDDAGDARILLDGHTGYDAEIKFGEAGAVRYTVGHDAATDNFVIGTTNVDTQQRLVINSSGYVGIGNSIGVTTITEHFHIKSTGDAGIFLEADTDNADETHNAYIKFSQDGGLVQGLVGFDSGQNDLTISNSYSSSIFLKTSNTTRITIAGNGAVTVAGSLSKGSGSFKIDHPLESKSDTHHLIHSFIEGPQADLIYRGKVDLVDGSATVNIDTIAGMTEGTFVALNREVQCFTSNESDWDAVKGNVSGNILTIECQNTSSTATVSWLVIGERQDPHMYETEWTDENGKVIVEPLKEIESTEE